MTIEVKVPQLPESVTDATLIAWHKTAGQTVQRDENLVDLETDKVVLEVPAPVSGVIKEIQIENGTTVTSGQLLAILEPGEAAAVEEPAAGKQESTASAVPAVAMAASNGKTNGPDAGKLSPAVRRMLEEHDIDPSHVQGSGRGGRILKSDIQNFMEKQIRQI